ncbi:hypothetical protein Cpar_1059 [Chlorobaculum parvum NCIB 8327]|uniref:Uncharacterized protein n=1 Tax=Chlorobaculum parvum (strain DSM 263 / NCIMB 8327) TaxID=517417 RepID=B3QNG4_CHLP8|nr:hypothetical protein [Chlorobaculum parvum]ACF11467.1 hypothetical protein Cpar_1059 [Chlorobaculum parvum NCIB 8327]
MLKEAAAVTGGALMFPPLGVAVVSCGVSGLLVAGAGMFFANTMMKERRAAVAQSGMAPEHVSLEDKLHDPFSSND